MENLSSSVRLRLQKILSHQYSSVPEEFISDAIGEAYTIFLLKAPVHVRENPAKRFRCLKTVATRRLYNESKRLSHFVRQNHEHEKKIFIEIENPFISSETVHILMECLTPLLKETAELHFLKGFSYEEVSEQLHENLETVKKRCKRAKAEMQEIWNGER
jgi:DNA-directed RNA polymerase specialized sigma24 family protein